MHKATILVYGLQGRLADELRGRAVGHGVWLREAQHVKAARSLLRAGEPTVLVLKLGRDLEGELGLLEEAGRLFPATATVVVGDTDHPALAGLAWDLGARYVLFPPAPLEQLPDLVLPLLTVDPEG